MPDNFEMYKKLFNAITTVIMVLQEAQMSTEEMFISADETESTSTTAEKEGRIFKKEQ